MWHSATNPNAVLKLKQVTCVPAVWRRCESNYNAYPTFDTPSPYKATLGVRRQYEYKLYKGGDESAAFLQFVCCLHVNHMAGFMDVV